MRGNRNTSWKFFTLIASVLLAQLIARMIIGKNEIYRMGVGVGEDLRDSDDELDPKDLDAELRALAERMGGSPEALKLFGSDAFIDGATYGYYKREILGES